MFDISNLRSRRLTRAVQSKVLSYMKEHDVFIPDRNWILSLLLPDEAGSILDIGPNVYLFRELLDRPKRAKYSYCAMDVEKRFEKSDNVNEVMHDANVAPYPFPDGSFDLIIASDVIEHIRDTDTFLSEVARLLKPEGQFFLSTPNYASLFCIAKALRGLMFHDPLGREVDRYCYREHVHFFTHKGLYPYLEHFGLHASYTIASGLKTDIDFARRNGAWGKLLTLGFNAASRMSYRLSPEIFVIAGKLPARNRIVRAA
jgi:SAM-dependent methyltransferase